MNLQELEAIRQKKQYREVLDALRRNEITDPAPVTPIAVDSIRGLMRRSFTAKAVEQLWLELEQITNLRLTDNGFRGEVDNNTGNAVGLRRDISRLGGEIAAVVDNNTEIGRRMILKKAQSISVDERDQALMQIEEWQIMVRGGENIETKNLARTLQVAVGDDDKNNDRCTAVIDWAMEIAILQGRGINEVLEVVNPNMTSKEKVKRLGRVLLRLGQECLRETTVHATKNLVSQEKREKISEQWQKMVEIWGD